MEDLAKNTGDVDEQKWVSATEAAEMLQMSRKRVVQLTLDRGYTRRKAHRQAPPFFLRKEIESWADFRQMRRQWLKKYKSTGGKNRRTEKIEVGLAQRLFITTAEAASLLGISPVTMRRLAQSGRLYCYQHLPGHHGSRLWFSRRAILQLKEDPGRLKCQESYAKGRAHSMESNRHGINQARTVRGGVPKGWLTVREAAERLGVCPSRVLAMRVAGRLRGEQIWRRNKPLKYWYFPDYEVERAISLREEIKRLSGLPLLPVPGSAPDKEIAAKEDAAKEGAASGAPTTPTGTEERRTAFVPKAGSPFRLDADGPEPKWACDDVNLTRFFYLQGKSEY